MVHIRTDTFKTQWPNAKGKLGGRREGAEWSDKLCPIPYVANTVGSVRRLVRKWIIRIAFSFGKTHRRGK